MIALTIAITMQKNNSLLEKLRCESTLKAHLHQV